jgi:HEAT repeat protein
LTVVLILALCLVACTEKETSPSRDPDRPDLPEVPRPDPTKFASPAGGQVRGSPDAMGRVPNPLKGDAQYKEASEEEIQKLVEELTRPQTDPSRSSITVARELMNIGPKAIPFLEEALEHEHPQVREMAVFILVNMMSVKSAAKIGKLLDDEDHQVRIGAARGLGGLKCEEALDALLEHMDMKDTHARFFVLNSLGFQEDPKALPALGRIAKEAEEVAVRRSALYAIGQIKDPEGIQYLVPHMHDPDKEVRVNVYRALGEIGGKEALPHLLEGLGDTYGMAQREAVLGLNTVGGPEVLQALMEVLETEQREEVIHSAVWTIGQLGDGSHIDAIRPFLSDRNVKIKETAFRAMESLLKAPPYKDVIPMLGDEDSDKVRFALWLIARDASEDKEVLPSLIPLTKSEDPQVRVTALQALGPFRDRTLCPVFAEVLSTETDPEIVIAAVQSSLIYVTKSVGYQAGVESTRSKEEVQMLYLRDEDALLPHYIRLLMHEDMRIRRLAIMAIEKAASDDFDYAFDADQETRLAGQKRVEAWYGERKGLGPDEWMRRSVKEAIGKLEMDDPVERQIWSEALRSVTGQPFRLALDASPEDVEATIQKWKGWWETNGAKTHLEWLMDALADPARPVEERMGIFFDIFWFYTTERFGVTPQSSEEEKLAAIEATLEWWGQNKSRFVTPGEGGK